MLQWEKREKKKKNQGENNLPNVYFPSEKSYYKTQLNGPHNREADR